MAECAFDFWTGFLVGCVAMFGLGALITVMVLHLDKGTGEYPSARR